MRFEFAWISLQSAPPIGCRQITVAGVVTKRTDWAGCNTLKVYNCPSSFLVPCKSLQLPLDDAKVKRIAAFTCTSLDGSLTCKRIDQINSEIKKIKSTLDTSSLTQEQLITWNLAAIAGTMAKMQKINKANESDKPKMIHGPVSLFTYCKNGHVLVCEPCPEGIGVKCDICNKSIIVRNTVYTCFRCRFDMCGNCGKKQKAKWLETNKFG